MLDLTKESIIWFLDHNEILNEKGERLTFEDRRFLYDPMCDWSQYQVHKKCGQIGMSVTMVVKSIWAVKNKEWNIIHTFPSDSDSNEFVDTKTNKILQQNAAFVDIESDNVHRKGIGDRFLYYKGTISKTAMIMTSADLIIADEYDRSDVGVVDSMDSRLQASAYRGMWWLSNPSIEGAGVDDKWQKSDKKEWHVVCKNGHSHPLTWPDSVNADWAQYVCKECKAKLTDDDRRNGEWVAEVPGAVISGYHISLMMAPWIPAQYITEKWDDGKNPEKFFNFVLGEPYSPGESKVTRTMILDNWTPQPIRDGNYYIGVDVGNLKHFVVGTEKGIVRVGTFTDWHDLDDLIDQYRPKVVVIDALPDNTMALYYKDKYPQVFINYFDEDHRNNVLVSYGEGDKQGIVYSDRNRVIDRIVNELLEGKILYSLPADRDFQEYIKHCAVMRRIKVMNAKGVERYIWEAVDSSKSKDIGVATKPDHFFFATIYWWLAKETMGTGMVLSDTPQEKETIMRTRAGFVSHIHEALEEKAYGNDASL